MSICKTIFEEGFIRVKVDIELNRVHIEEIDGPFWAYLTLEEFLSMIKAVSDAFKGGSA